MLVAQSRMTLCGLDHQAPLSMEFHRQEYWSELPCPSPEHLRNPGIESWVSHIAGRFFTILSYQGSQTLVSLSANSLSLPALTSFTAESQCGQHNTWEAPKYSLSKDRKKRAFFHFTVFINCTFKMELLKKII